MNMIKNVCMILFLLWSMHAQPESIAQQDTYQQAREQALGAATHAVDAGSTAHVLLIETNHNALFESLQVFNDGRVEVYASNGLSIANIQSIRQVSVQGQALLQSAEGLSKEFHLTNEYPAPKTGFVRFYLVMATGVFTIEVKQDVLNNSHRLSGLYRDGKRLLAYAKGADQYRLQKKQKTELKPNQ